LPITVMIGVSLIASSLVERVDRAAGFIDGADWL
jgi:hypothetical protein